MVYTIFKTIRFRFMFSQEKADAQVMHQLSNNLVYLVSTSVLALLMNCTYHPEADRNTQSNSSEKIASDLIEKLNLQDFEKRNELITSQGLKSENLIAILDFDFVTSYYAGSKHYFFVEDRYVKRSYFSDEGRIDTETGKDLANGAHEKFLSDDEVNSLLDAIEKYRFLTLEDANMDSCDGQNYSEWSSKSIYFFYNDSTFSQFNDLNSKFCPYDKTIPVQFLQNDFSDHLKNLVQ
jgi:hypothetical protein